MINGKGIKFVINKNTITISIRLNISGTLSNEKLNKKTYKTRLIDAIKNRWKGSFTVFGYKINLSTQVKEADSNCINVYMINKLGISKHTVTSNWNVKNCGGVTMYKGDSRNDLTYNATQFAWVTTHEFGHVFGTSDLYDPKTFKSDYKSVMGEFCEYFVKSFDVKRVILAMVKNQWQK